LSRLLRTLELRRVLLHGRVRGGVRHFRHPREVWLLALGLLLGRLLRAEGFGTSLDWQDAVLVAIDVAVMMVE